LNSDWSSILGYVFLTDSLLPQYWRYALNQIIIIGPIFLVSLTDARPILILYTAPTLARYVRYIGSITAIRQIYILPIPQQYWYSPRRSCTNIGFLYVLDIWPILSCNVGWVFKSNTTPVLQNVTSRQHTNIRYSDWADIVPQSSSNIAVLPGNMLAGECSIVTLITVYTLGLNSAQMMLKRDSRG
jgi:hypothetical protein